MKLREQFEKEINKFGTVFETPDYINWLQNRCDQQEQEIVYLKSWIKIYQVEIRKYKAKDSKLVFKQAAEGVRG